MRDGKRFVVVEGGGVMIRDLWNSNTQFEVVRSAGQGIRPKTPPSTPTPPAITVSVAREAPQVYLRTAPPADASQYGSSPRQNTRRP